MNVEELIKMLKEFPPKATVMLSSDEEGNSYEHVSSVPGAGVMVNGEIEDALDGKFDTLILYPESAY